MGYIGLYAILINMIGFIWMGVDKKKSTHHKWRISERRFFITAALGGAVGVRLGMTVFHHKTKHSKFVYGIPALILFNLALYGYIIYWLHKSLLIS